MRDREAAYDSYVPDTTRPRSAAIMYGIPGELSSILVILPFELGAVRAGANSSCLARLPSSHAGADTLPQHLEKCVHEIRVELDPGALLQIRLGGG